MKTTAFFIILFCTLTTGLFSQPTAGSRGTLSSEFQKYMKDKTKYNFGYIPSPVITKRKRPLNFQHSKDLPAVYDLRNEGYITSIKNQGNSNACWSFSTMAVLESRWKRLGYGEYDLSENNLYYGHGFVGLNRGGNAWMATAYLTRGDGPVLESEDPFEYDEGSYHPGITPSAHIAEAYFLPDNDKELIKQTIYDCGAVAVAMHWDDIYYNSSNYTYCFTGSNTTDTNHMVTVIGWDDNKITSGGNGAWIVKNSWGTTWGENGYFYISYNDVKMNISPTIWLQRENFNTDLKIYQYDKLGATGNWGWSNGEDFGLIKFNISGGSKLDRIGTYLLSANSAVEIEIYDNFNGQILSDLLTSIDISNHDHAGYYTFPLTTQIEFENENDIYIKIKYISPESNWPLPVEYPIENYSDPEIEIGKCWISDTGNNNTWYALGADTEYKLDLAIKAYTKPINGIGIDSNVIPDTNILYQNYPNPFNPATTINFYLSSSDNVKLTIFNSSGKIVKNLLNKSFQKGNYSIKFKPHNLTSGIYYYQLETSKQSVNRKMILSK